MFYIRNVNTLCILAESEVQDFISSFWPGRFYFQKEENGEGDLITKPDGLL